MPEDRLRGVSGQLGNWLRGAGRNTYSLPSSSLTGSLFKSGAKRQVGMVVGVVYCPVCVCRWCHLRRLMEPCLKTSSLFFA